MLGSRYRNDASLLHGVLVQQGKIKGEDDWRTGRRYLGMMG